MGQLASQAATDDYTWLWTNTTPEQHQHIIAVTPANELNLDVEHQGDVEWPGYWKSYQGYRTIDNWLTIWAEAWQQMAIHYGWQPQIWWPALAPGHQPPQGQGQWYVPGPPPPESEYELLRRSIAAYDDIGLHCYGPIADEWTGSGRLARIVDKLESLGLGNKPRHVTEVNQINYPRFLSYAGQLGIDKSYWFLWCGNPDHAAYDLKPPWIDGLAEYIKEGETPMSEWSIHAVLDAIYEAASGEGYNPDTGITSYAAEHPQIGLPMAKEIDNPAWPYVLRPYTNAVVAWRRRDGYTTAVSATPEGIASLPLA